MSHPLLSEALKEAYLNYGSTADVVETIEVSTSAESLWLCTGFSVFTATDENGVVRTFQPVPFKFSLPAQDTTGARSLNIAIENVDGSVIRFINLGGRNQDGGIHRLQRIEALLSNGGIKVSWSRQQKTWVGILVIVITTAGEVVRALV